MIRRAVLEQVTKLYGRVIKSQRDFHPLMGISEEDDL